MTIVLNTVDQVPGAGIIRGPQLAFKVGQITARDIVRARVAIEVERYNRAPEAEIPRYFGLVAPPAAELELNGPNQDLRPRRTLDADAQIEVALDAVRRGRVVLLFNGVQVSDLDEQLPVTPVSEARFLRLVPLVGG